MRKYFNMKKLMQSIVIVLLLTALILSIFIFYISEQSYDYYTVYADDGYYSETTYLLNENSYHQYVQLQGANEEISQRNSLQTTSSIKDYDFVGAIVKDVWVSEKTDENGVVIDSDLMTKNELDELRAVQASAQTLAQSTTLSTGETVVDRNEDSKASKYRLTIKLSLYHIMPDDKYYVVAKSSWKQEFVWFWMGEEAAEEGSEDIMGVTWGGSGNIKAVGNYSISGRYYDGAGYVTFSSVEENRFGAYIWSFFEKSGWGGKELQEAAATLYLQSQTNENKETNIKFSYIHTYGSIDISGSVGVSMGSNPSVAPSLTINTTNNAWKIGIDCGGLFY